MSRGPVTVTLTGREASLLLANEWNDHPSWSGIAQKIRSAHRDRSAGSDGHEQAMELPADPVARNNHRAMWGDVALRAFAEMTGLDVEADGWDTAISDLLAGTSDGWDHVAEPATITTAEDDDQTDAGTECRHCGYPVIDGSGAVVRCEVCGSFCCEDHHRRHPSYARHDIGPDVVHTGEWCDACTHPESLHDERIRTVGDGVAPCSTCAVCVAVHTGDPGDDEPGIEEYDHSRAKEDARNARYRR